MGALFCLMKSVSGPSRLSILSPVKLLVKFWMPPAAASSLAMIALKSGCSAVSSTAPSSALGESGAPNEMLTKFCPIRPVNLMMALLSVFTLASSLSFMVTLTFSSVISIFSTRPISTPAILTRSPTFKSCTVSNSALTCLPRLNRSALPRVSMMSTAAHTVMATKKPSLVSSEFFIGWVVYRSRLKSAFKNSCTRRSLKFFTASGVPTVTIWPSIMTAMRSATPNARSRSWDTTSDVTWMR